MESINDRVKQVRKKQGLTQKDFGKYIGMKSNSISDIENGKNSVTDSVFRLICSVYNVNESWLRTGEGGDENMFLKPQTNDLASKATQLLGKKDPVFEAFVATYSQLTPSNRKVLLDFGVQFLKKLEVFVSEKPYDIHAEIPDTPGELEERFPPVDGTNGQNKSGVG